jgi:isopenicillin N synthase-like dioxygenase
MATDDVPEIDASPLFGPPSRERESVDMSVHKAMMVTGMMAITGLPPGIDIDAAARRRMLRLFDLPSDVIEGLAGNTRDPSRPLSYRGWFPPQPGRLSRYEAFQIGADVARGSAAVHDDDPLAGPTPMPPEAAIPGWREAVRSHFLAMERVGATLLRSLARGLGLSESELSKPFVGGASQMRLLRYLPRPAAATAEADGASLFVVHDDNQHMIVSEPHVDFGCLTLLLQDSTPGLQVRLPGGSWIDVLPREGRLVVNCGRLLATWTGGRAIACEHRVLSPERPRFSIPFFFEPRLDWQIAPLPLANTARFAPFLYGDYVWSSLPRVRRLFGDRPPRQRNNSTSRPKHQSSN